MEPVPTDLFIKACKEVVKANADYVPPYGTGGTLYLRPLLIGVGDIIGVKPAEEYIFTVLPCQLATTSKAPGSDQLPHSGQVRPCGTKWNRGTKVGGNYAASLLPGQYAKSRASQMSST